MVYSRRDYMRAAYRAGSNAAMRAGARAVMDPVGSARSAARVVRDVAAVSYAARAAGRYLSKGNKKTVLKTDPSDSSGSKQYVAKRRPKKKQSRSKNPLKKLEVQVKNLQMKANSGLGLLHYRKRDSNSLKVSTVGQRNYNHFGSMAYGNIETVLAQCQFLNPATPGTLTTADLSSGTYSRQVLFKNIYQRIIIMNNYQVPCKVNLYHMRVKSDTSLTPSQCYNNVSDSLISGASTSPLVQITESNMIRDLWSITQSVKRVLQPGETLKATSSVKNIEYDASIYDSHADTYQTDIKTGFWFVVIEGVIQHDTSLAQVGLGLCGVDIIDDTYYDVCYDAGIELERIYILDNSATSFTNGGVCSEKPVADNITYSVS